MKMLQYVMTKLETHNINSDGQIMPNHLEQAAEEDSGTETDDETGGPDEDTMDLTDDDEGHRPRPSSTPANMYTLGSLSYHGSSSSRSSKEATNSIEVNSVVSSSSSTSATPTFFVTSCQTSDMDGGSHSSEEELEEINNIPLLPNSSSSSSTLSTPPPATPVEFSTTPPNHVHKPRRSTSPPPLVHDTESVATPILHFSSSGHVPGAGHASFELRSHDEQRRNERRAIASKKRYKQSRIHHIQRPCLDFEKMQLLKTRAITSWRHGGELSLFCW